MRLIILDAIAEDAEGHLCRDDLFLARTLSPCIEKVSVFTAPEGVAAILKCGFENVDVKATVLSSATARRFAPAWLRRLVRMLAVGSCGRDVILAPAFDEVAVLLFRLVHPRVRMHLVVHYNLSALAGGRWHRWFRTWLMRRTIAAATSVVVHTTHAVRQVQRLARDTSGSAVALVRFHQAGIERPVVSWDARRHRMVYLGWARSEKQLDEFLRLALQDDRGQFSYGIFGAFVLTASQQEAVSRLGDRVEVRSQYIPDDEYYALLSESMYVVLPYAREYEGSMSGVFCDAISTGTPVIASAIEPFIEYRDRHGPIGHLVDFADQKLPESVFIPPDAATFGTYQCSLLSARKMHHQRLVRRSICEAIGVGVPIGQ